MLTKFSSVDWDDGNRGKRQKHGVSIQEIEEMLVGQPAILPLA